MILYLRLFIIHIVFVIYYFFISALVCSDFSRYAASVIFLMGGRGQFIDAVCM